MKRPGQMRPKLGTCGGLILVAAGGLLHFLVGLPALKMLALWVAAGGAFVAVGEFYTLRNTPKKVGRPDAPVRRFPAGLALGTIIAAAVAAASIILLRHG